MALTTENICSAFAYDDALIEDLQTMDDYVFYKEHDEEFDYYEQYLSNSACGRFGNGRRQKKFDNRMRYKKLKCLPDEQIQYAQKMAVKRVNAEQKKINDMYARNRRNAHNAVLQETKEPAHDEVDTIVKKSLWNFDDEEIDFIEKKLILYQYGAQKLFGGSLKTLTDGVNTYPYCYTYNYYYTYPYFYIYTFSD
jgi:hypothetical protein